MKLGFLCRAAGIDCPRNEYEREISAICVDSRRAVSGCLYICIRGLRTDGHRYIEEAIRNGATAILMQEGSEIPTQEDAILLCAKDTRSACAILFDAWYGFPSQKLRFIGVTGTNGKTSVTHMLRHILECSFYRVGLIGTVGCTSAGKAIPMQSHNPLANMTTPDPEDLYPLLAQMAEDGVEYVLMEVTSHALALGKLAPIRFCMAIFTNLTPEHLDCHGDMEHYANTKAMLFEKSECAVINLDSPYAQRMMRHCTGRIRTCGRDGGADYTYESAQVDSQGVSYRLLSQNFNLQIRCPVSGNFTVVNSMQAAIGAIELGIGAGAVKDALASLGGVKGRLERVRLDFDADFRVFIDYAHTPDALENLLRTAREICPASGRIVLVFGCGGERDQSKRAPMGRIATDLADWVIVTSDNSRGEDPDTIIEQILLGIKKNNYTVIPDRSEAIRHAVMTAKSQDIILLAGKGHEEYEITGSGKKPFYEKEIVRKAFDARQKRKKSIGERESGI